MFLAFSLFFSMAVYVQEGETVCYKDLEGCFDNKGAYNRDLALPPQSREAINTTFLLYTKNNTDQYQIVSAGYLSSIQQSNFNGSKESVFIVHGWRDSCNATWAADLCKSILQREDVNCFCVDWSGGSSAIYNQAISNVAIVGAETAKFIKTVVENCNSSLSEMHLIGHSLGAQAAGEAGKRCPGIRTIFGLDPAGPGFTGQSTVVRLDSTDARTVIVIHTNIGPAGFGTSDRIGNQDFFPNGGQDMPGCNLSLGTILDPLEGLQNFIGCSHNYAYKVFTASIFNPEGFMGYCASNYSSFQTGQGFPCSSNNCSVMGFYAKTGNTSSCQGAYYLNTGPPPDFARYRYKVIVPTGGSGTILGSVSFTMYKSSNSSDKQKIYGGLVAAGKNFSVFVDARLTPPFDRVTFTWENFLPFSSSSLYAESMTLTFGNNGSQYMFCSNETTKRENPQTLTPCPLPTPMSESTKS